MVKKVEDRKIIIKLEAKFHASEKKVGEKCMHLNHLYTIKKIVEEIERPF